MLNSHARKYIGIDWQTEREVFSGDRGRHKLERGTLRKWTNSDPKPGVREQQDEPRARDSHGAHGQVAARRRAPPPDARALTRRRGAGRHGAWRPGAGRGNRRRERTPGP